MNPKENTATFRRGCIKTQYEMVSKRCPKNIEWDIIEGEKRWGKRCVCDTEKCNGGAMTIDPPTKKCVKGADCETPNDCGEGGSCHRHW